ncbi:MAG TPA: hypothetical protein VFU65_21660 [Actinocrinis sp.]|nr:hypothetical protein [Actinocrinis sp.]
MSNVSNTPVEQDWRFAELVARSWMEPELVVRYAADPCAVLAEFGLEVTRREDAPSLEPYCGPDLIIEDLEHARGHHLHGCICWNEPGAGVDATPLAGEAEPAKEPSA